MQPAKKEDYICTVPFVSLEIHDHKRFLCCASWLKKYLPEDTSPKDAWTSKEAFDIRESILDGSYKYCDSHQCPFLHQLETIGDVGKVYPLVKKTKIRKNIQDKINDHKNGTLTPSTIQFSFDRTCNLECPSCRVKIFTASGKKIKEVQKTIDEIQEQYSGTTKTLYITGSGDPFISVGFRNFLRNFNAKDWPMLENIHLHTNATKWSKKMWESMPNIHKYVKTCEISIDAGTKDTYENKTRIGGNWEELITNLKFISTLPDLKEVKTSFVVQKDNYKEMKIFYDLILQIFGKKALVFYGKINNWGTFSDTQFKEHKIWDNTHPEYDKFIDEVNSFLPAKQVFNNLQEFMGKKTELI